MSKRFFDLILALIGFVAIAPIVFVCILAIRLTTSGPSLFRQERLGHQQVPFILYKLRTMETSAPARPTHLSDPAIITPIGRILRRWKLDELPQLWNVIRGDMSLVGPRPCLPTQHTLIQARAKAGAFDVRPGITGLAQVQGIDMSHPEHLAEIDGLYARSRTFQGDVKILFLTLMGRGLRSNPAIRNPE
ncbi:MAG: lipid carrier--UDP-N-acetylgalactosaminyltransferase [Hyphomicrobium sp. 32-62-53]|nr:MAG: lipid carrier--UDP-N-acetylgalactosaminyltransferase [Hyphomicrobium sp. 12-62-95]OYX97285.1 MAG: lipid carrier--UDP-N-acetylgalactosaminyltransferase [Hyphomicrobium sp. 32-62-53]